MSAYRTPRVNDRHYLEQVSRLPCALTLRPGVQAAHIRYPAPYKRYVGMGEKPGDRWVVPLCPQLHTMLAGAQHNFEERRWWKWVGVDPIRLANGLWGARDNFEWQEEIVHMMAPTGQHLTRVGLLLGGRKPNLKELDDEPTDQPCD